MPAVDALNVRTRFAEQMASASWDTYVNSYIASEMNAGGGVAAKRHVGEQDPWNATRMRNAMMVAETYYVAPDMMQLALMAGEDFPEDETILKPDLPSEAGFMYFPQPFRMLELRGRVMHIHAVLWANNRFWAIGDRLDPSDEMSQQIVEQFGADFVNRHGRYDIALLGAFEFGKPMPKMMMFDKGVLPPSAIVKFSQDAEGRTVMYTDHPVASEDGTIKTEARTDPFLKFVLATWRLMQQSLADVYREEKHLKAYMRYAQRAKQPTGVTVIALRRVKRDYEPTGRTISYRTLVRGHWRRVWCGPKDGERYRRAVYVHDFIRGPEGAPLIIRDRVNALVR